MTLEKANESTTLYTTIIKRQTLLIDQIMRRVTLENMMMMMRKIKTEE